MSNKSSTDLSTFNFMGEDSSASFPIRVTYRDGQPWFIAADVCRAMGLDVASGVYKHLTRLSRDEKLLILAPQFNCGASSHGGMRAGTKTTIISEAGLYKLLMRCDRAEAEPFQTWVARDVLPSIRQHGIYVKGQELIATGQVSLAQLGQTAADAYKSLCEALQIELAKVQAENTVMAAELDNLTVDEYRALKHQYWDHKQNSRVGVWAAKEMRRLASELARWKPQWGTGGSQLDQSRWLRHGVQLRR